MRIRTFFPLLLLTSIACNDEPAKPKQAAPTPEPIASDIVYNSAFEGKSAPLGSVLTPDAGPTSELAALAGTPGKAKVVDPGAEPRTKLAYAFAMGKPRTVTSTLKLNVSAEGMEGAGAQPPIKFTFTVTPKTRDAKGLVHFEVKVTAVDIAVGSGAGAPPDALAQKAALEKAFTGLEGSFDSSTQGDIDNVKFNDDKVPPQVGEMLELLSAAFEIMVVPLPSDPVGVGGKWATSSNAGRGKGTQTATMTLLSKTDTGASLKVDSVMGSPPATISDPQAPPGTTVETKGSGAYTIDIRFDGVASKALGSQNVDRIAKVPNGPTQKIGVKIDQDLTSK